MAGFRVRLASESGPRPKPFRVRSWPGLALHAAGRVTSASAWQITEGFMACAVKDSDTLRFAVGDRVQCRVDDRWVTGEVVRVRLPTSVLALPSC